MARVYPGQKLARSRSNIDMSPRSSIEDADGLGDDGANMTDEAPQLPPKPATLMRPQQLTKHRSPERPHGQAPTQATFLSHHFHIRNNPAAALEMSGTDDDSQYDDSSMDQSMDATSYYMDSESEADDSTGNRSKRLNNKKPNKGHMRIEELSGIKEDSNESEEELLRRFFCTATEKKGTLQRQKSPRTMVRSVITIFIIFDFL